MLEGPPEIPTTAPARSTSNVWSRVTPRWQPRSKRSPTAHLNWCVRVDVLRRDVLWNDQPVESRGGGKAGFVLGVIPVSLVQMAGTAKITVRDGSMVSNALDFTIYGKPAPRRKSPSYLRLGPLPGAASTCSRRRLGGGCDWGWFPSGFDLVVDGKPLNTTVFRHDTFISATIPSALVAKAGAHRIWVANPDKKISNKVEFKVTAN